MTTTPQISREDAVKAGFRPITSVYKPYEMAMLERAVAQMAGCKFVVVQEEHGPAIWRAAQEMAIDEHDAADVEVSV